MDAIKAVVEDMVSRNINIDSALQVKMRVMSVTQHNVSIAEVI